LASFSPQAGIQKVDRYSDVECGLPEVTVWIPGFAEDDGAQNSLF
jgi:hypothetical protein